MKRFGITVLGSALALAGSLLFGAGVIGSSGIAEAAPGADNVTVSSQQMLPDGTDQVTFSWISYNQGTQWLDISSDPNFAGNFQSSGPIASGQNTFVWNGLQSGVTYFVRVNTLTAYGWISSAPVNFTLQGFNTTPYGYYPGYNNGYYPGYNGSNGYFDPSAPIFPPELNQPAPVQTYPYYMGFGSTPPTTPQQTPDGFPSISGGWNVPTS